MKRSWIRLITVLLLVCSLLPLSAYADMGPKPSIRITFSNLGEEPCYGTLLSRSKSTGPDTAWDGKPENARYTEGDPDYEIWNAFQGFSDPTNYYFLQIFWRVDETKQLNWTYYPPKDFILLLYYPESNRFALGTEEKKYAFDSYYTAQISPSTADGNSIDLTRDTITLTRSYRYFGELLGLVGRVVLTVLVELALAFIFGYRGKKLYRLLVIVNVITQLLLNGALNWFCYYNGALLLIPLYVVLEILVTVIESAIYIRKLPRLHRRPSPAAYAITANALSFVVGLFLANLLPGLF